VLCRRAVLPRDNRRPGEKDYVYRNALATKAASVTARTRRFPSGQDEGERWFQKDDFGVVGPTFSSSFRVQTSPSCCSSPHWPVPGFDGFVFLAL